MYYPVLFTNKLINKTLSDSRSVSTTKCAADLTIFALLWLETVYLGLATRYAGFINPQHSEEKVIKMELDKSIALQKQVRENADTLRNEFLDMKSWEQQMKKADMELIGSGPDQAQVNRHNYINLFFYHYSMTLYQIEFQK